MDIVAGVNQHGSALHHLTFAVQGKCPIELENASDQIRVDGIGRDRIILYNEMIA